MTDSYDPLKRLTDFQQETNDWLRTQKSLADLESRHIKSWLTYLKLPRDTVSYAAEIFVPPGEIDRREIKALARESDPETLLNCPACNNLVKARNLVRHCDANHRGLYVPSLAELIADFVAFETEVESSARVEGVTRDADLYSQGRAVWDVGPVGQPAGPNLAVDLKARKEDLLRKLLACRELSIETKLMFFLRLLLPPTPNATHAAVVALREELQRMAKPRSRGDKASS